MNYYCAQCGKLIERHIGPADIARRKHLFCSKRCGYEYLKLHHHNKGAHWDWGGGVHHYSQHGMKPPKNCPASVESCELCPYPDCILP